MYEETPPTGEWLSQCCRESILICILYFIEDCCNSLWNWFSNTLSSLILWLSFTHEAVWNLARAQLVNVLFTLLKSTTIASKAGLGDLVKYPANNNKPHWIQLLDLSMSVNSLELEESRFLCLCLDPWIHSQAWDWRNLNWFKPGSSLIHYATWTIFKTSCFHFVTELFGIS